MKKLFSLFLLFFSLYTFADNPFSTGKYIAPPVYWTTYYINAATGNDATGTGTLGAPWATLNKATTTITTAGNLIYAQAGTYIETTTCNFSPGVSLTGDGATTIIKSTITAANTPILAFQSAEGTNGNQSISFVTIDGNSLATQWAVEIKGRSNISFHDCTIQNFLNRGIMWSGRNDNNALPPTIYATGNSFYNNIVNNCSGYIGGTGWGGLMIGGQTGMLVYNNTMTQVGRGAGNNGWPIKYVNDGYLNGCKIYNNTITKDAYDGITWDFAIELFNVAGLEIYGNTIIGSVDLNYQDTGIYQFSADIHDNIIGPTTLQLQHERGVILEFQTFKCLIRNNTFKNLYNPIFYSCRNLSPVFSNVISNNLMYNIGTTAGTQEGTGIMFRGQSFNNYICTNLKIYNNTMIGDNSAQASKALDLTDAGSITGCEIKNNLFQNFAYSYLFGDPGTAINGCQVYTNDIYNCGFSNADHYAGGSPVSITYSGNISSAPNLDGSYKPTGAPLVDVGTNVGLPYLSTFPDIGFWEYGTVVTPPVTIKYRRPLKM